MKIPITDFAWVLSSSSCHHKDWLVPIIRARLFDDHLMEFLVMLAEKENAHVYALLVAEGLLIDAPFDDFVEKEWGVDDDMNIVDDGHWTLDK